MLFSCSSKERDKPAAGGSGSAAPVTAVAGDASTPSDAPVAAIDAAVAEPDSAYRWYRVEAIVDKLGSVPFVIGVHRTRPEGVVWSAQERLPLVVLSREPLVLRVPVRGIELTLSPDPKGGGTADDPARRGTWRAKYYFKRDFDIRSVPIAEPRPDLLFPGTAAPAADISGEWRFDITEFGIARGRFAQDAAGVVTGTVIPPEIGDLRFLTGRVHGQRVQVSAFDGIHGFHIDMTSRDGGKTLEGTWLIAGIGKLKLRATRETPPDTHVKVSARLAPGATRLSLPQLNEAPYKGNPVIVDYFGSWCPVCIDLTPELVRLQREHAASGLQVLSIALEPPGDEAETRRRLDEFRALFGMSWPFHIVFTDDFNGAVTPEILDATGFPVTIFIRRDGTVSGVHTGFVSKAAGPEHEAAVQVLERYVSEIVAPTAPPSEKR